MTIREKNNMSMIKLLYSAQPTTQQPVLSFLFVITFK